MEVQNAKNHYLGKLGARLNCAQSVAAAFGEDPTPYAGCGGGRAPEGWCGAAHVAAQMTGDREGIEKQFLQLAGTVRCTELRSGRRLSCVACIEQSALHVQQARR